jgi:tRNA nucleotidyltransferase (CCA-adding enzyme)
MNVNQILKEVLEDIAPDDSSVRLVDDFLRKLNSELKKKKLKATAVLGGSFAKGTRLRGDHDVDIFVRFDLKYDSEKLSDLLEPCLKNWRPQRIHGSRDYFQIKNGMKLEIVPVLAIKKPKEAKNVTDFSPWHVSWTNNAGKKLKGEIMLAKKFLKAQKAYGAESYIKGFSGHVVDILVIHYGGFLKFLKAASNWKLAKKAKTDDEKQVVDHYNIYKGKALLMLNKSKLQSPLVLIDPVQPERNAAAALDAEHYNKHILAAKKFLKNPSKEFFVDKKTNFAKMAKKGTLVRIFAQSLPGSEDVSGTKLLKAFEFLRQKLIDAEFKLAEAGWGWNKKDTAIVWFVTKQKILPELELRQGPPAKREPFASEFEKKYKKSGKVFASKGRLFAKVTRKYRTAEQLLAVLLKDDYLKDKFKQAKLEK